MKKDKLLSLVSLLTSTSTLLCCVLPALIASLAGGAAVVSLITTFPFLITLSKYKIWIFFISGLIIVVNSIVVFRPNNKLVCQITGGDGCDITHKYSAIMMKIAIGIYLFGVFFTYALVPILSFLK